MLTWVIRVCFLILGGTTGVFSLPALWVKLGIGHILLINNPYTDALIGALIFYLITFWAVKYVEAALNWLEEKLAKIAIATLVYGGLGLFVGLVIAFFASNALSQTNIPLLNSVVPVILTLVLGYLGFRIGISRRNEFGNFVNNRNAKKRTPEEEKTEEKSKKTYKIMDTSVIIDGRIADILTTGFLDGTVVIPLFVLAELQHIADSSDTLKRTRGRRGLDILNRIQKEEAIQVEMYEGDFEDTPEVDSKLVKLAKVMGGIVVTNDYNLNKVCEFQNVPVLNINDLANAVKPVVLPGEKMTVLMVKDGKEHNQGVAYLDDGTMIVVEDGRKFINETIQVEVTSVLQTSAGRMIFAKPS
ncbi:PIN/TRAM domain-containing protein [Listeria monocytogenes]|nr:PIN/TRAM domain-containing protein [Listeria monocytogenes]MCD1850092.1 PIN/TRAM domain-containing protein [Listeria monocytogenes]MCD1853033.1 PIN/TRAM domain-containing protein [Listeria monocytogenes]MCD1858895.1 PIN/TRAM domain-containing protein [Listeria monocytogenes]MCD2049570.1 PIN/TRAM domain-containing protein [Listeria monocytogenes]